MRKNLNKLTGEVSYKYIGKYTDGYHEARLANNYGGNKASSVDINYFEEDYENHLYKSRFIQIPCGRCIGCRIDYSRSWADRMTYHYLTCPNDINWFVTLTYDPDMLEKHLSCKNDFYLYSLDYTHKDEFLTRLRNKYRKCDIDYYFSGEYGGETARPHLHAIIYNAPFDDLVFWKTNDNGDPIYISDQLQSLWDYGFCTISPFTWTSAAYTARYVEKKSFGYNAQEYKAFGLLPERSFSSRRPAIAKEYYIQNYKSLWANNGLDVGREVNSCGKLGIPRYFRKLASSGTKDCIGYEEFLENERMSIQKQNFDRPFKIENSSFDLNRVEKMLKFEEDNILNTSLCRKL